MTPETSGKWNVQHHSRSDKCTHFAQETWR